MEKTKKFALSLDIETMEDVIKLVDFSNSNYPFMKKSLYYLRDACSKIIQDGCFKHNILREIFRTSLNSSVSVCKLCNPKEYSKLQKGGLNSSQL